MADGLDLLTKYLPRGDIHTVKLRRGRETEIPVVDIVEAGQRVGDFALCTFVPLLMRLLERGNVAEVERGRQVKDIKQRETGTDGD